MSLEELWTETRPDDVTKTLGEYLEHCFEWAASPDQWTGVFLKSLWRTTREWLGKVRC